MNGTSNGSSNGTSNGSTTAFGAAAASLAPADSSSLTSRIPLSSLCVAAAIAKDDIDGTIVEYNSLFQRLVLKPLEVKAMEDAKSKPPSQTTTSTTTTSSTPTSSSKPKDEAQETQAAKVETNPEQESTTTNKAEKEEEEVVVVVAAKEQQPVVVVEELPAVDATSLWKDIVQLSEKLTIQESNEEKKDMAKKDKDEEEKKNDEKNPFDKEFSLPDLLQGIQSNPENITEKYNDSTGEFLKTSPFQLYQGPNQPSVWVQLYLQHMTIISSTASTSTTTTIARGVDFLGQVNDCGSHDNDDTSNPSQNHHHNHNHYWMIQIMNVDKEVRAKDQYSTILETTYDGFWDYHITKDYEYMSPRFWEMFGYSPEEKRHHPSEWMDMVHPTDFQASMQDLQQHFGSLGKVPYCRETRYKHKNGTWVWVLCRGKVIEWDHNQSPPAPIRMIGTHTDITQEKLRLEQEQDMITAKEQLKAEKQLNEFVAHEVRNPLAAAISATSFLQDEVQEHHQHQQQQGQSSTSASALAAELTEDLNIVADSLDYIHQLLTSMLDLNQFLEKGIKLNPRPAFLKKDLILPLQQLYPPSNATTTTATTTASGLSSSSSLSSSSKASSRKQTSIEFSWDAWWRGPHHDQSLHRLPLTAESKSIDQPILVDVVRLKQVLINLISNALKFTKEGFVRVLIGRMMAIGKGNAHRLHILVEDSGPGVPKDKQHLLFQKYVQLNTQIQGSGIGLALTQQIVLAMNGTISIDKTYQSGIPNLPGTRFQIEIGVPVLPVEEEEDNEEKENEDHHHHNHEEEEEEEGHDPDEDHHYDNIEEEEEEDDADNEEEEHDQEPPKSKRTSLQSRSTNGRVSASKGNIIHKNKATPEVRKSTTSTITTASTTRPSTSTPRMTKASNARINATNTKYKKSTTTTTSVNKKQVSSGPGTKKRGSTTVTPPRVANLSPNVQYTPRTSRRISQKNKNVSLEETINVLQKEHRQQQQQQQQQQRQNEMDHSYSSNVTSSTASVSSTNSSGSGKATRKSKISKGSTMSRPKSPISSKRAGVGSKTSNNNNNNSTTFDTSTLKVLIVDDDKIIRRLISRRLKKINSQMMVDTAESGEIAIRKVQDNVDQNTPQYDLIIMDHFMPLCGGQLTGTETILKIRPLIDGVIVGSSGNDMSQEHGQAGADLFWLKPVPKEDDVLLGDLQTAFDFKQLATPSNENENVLDDTTDYKNDKDPNGRIRSSSGSRSSIPSLPTLMQ